MKLENLPSDVQEYMKHMYAALELAPKNGWAYSKLWDVLSEEVNRYGCQWSDFNEFEEFDRLKPIVDTDD